MNVIPTPLAKQYLAEKRREARAILLGGAAYTPSQRGWAWATLTGMQPHPRALANDTAEPAPGDVGHIGDPADFDEGGRVA